MFAAGWQSSASQNFHPSWFAKTLPTVVLPDPVKPIKTTIIHFTPYSCHLKIDSVQSIEYISVEEVIQPKTLLSLEVRVNSVDHVAIFLAPVGTGRSVNPPGDYNVSTATKSENKTSFVEAFLSGHPEGNVKAVNDAWTAAGMNGTVGSTLIYKLRSQMGLSGNLRTKSKPTKAAKPKPATSMSKTADSPGKTMFVKEFLNDHPQGNVDAVNEAWHAAGFDGTISSTLVNKTRALLGLTGNIRGNIKKSKSSATGKKPASRRKETTAAVNGKPRVSRSAILEEIEADIDRLIFKAMAIGDLTEIEDSLRRARRLLYGALTGG
jgi:hypothetical protein